MASDERHTSVDFEIVPDLVCGRSYRNPESEALAVAMRAGEVTPYTGCGKPLRWVYAYRCRQCGRWLHGPCIDRHFGSGELAAAQARAERAEARASVMHETLTLISRGTWTARNSVESMVWSARQALKKVAALREALGLAIAGLTNLSELRILTGQYRTEANELVERLCAALAAAGGEGQG